MVQTRWVVKTRLVARIFSAANVARLINGAQINMDEQDGQDEGLYPMTPQD